MTVIWIYWLKHNILLKSISTVSFLLELCFNSFIQQTRLPQSGPCDCLRIQQPTLQSPLSQGHAEFPTRAWASHCRMLARPRLTSSPRQLHKPGGTPTGHPLGLRRGREQHGPLPSPEQVSHDLEEVVRSHRLRTFFEDA